MVNYNKYVKVNKRSIKLAIQEGVRPMTEFFDPSRENLPYFWNSMSPGENFGNWHDKNWSFSHVPGRWLNAIFNAKDVLNVDVDNKVIENLKKWTYRSIEEANIRFPAHINLKTMKTEKITDLHNLREVMHGLYALAAFNKEEKAKNLAKDIILAVNKYFDYDKCTLKEKFYNESTGAIAESRVRDPKDKDKFPFPTTFGRYIGPLVKLYDATGLQDALHQALLLKESCFKNILNSQGDYNPTIFGKHTHSTTSMISSLAQLGDVTNDLNTLTRVKNFMENGLKEIALDFGWCVESYYRRTLLGEINNTSDIMETCLVLGKHGFEGYYARAERILRGHFLPSQLLDTEFIPEQDNPEEKRGLASRSKGSFGFPCPYGHEDFPGSEIAFNWDIVGGGVGGLCEAYRHINTKHNDLISINLLFDYDNKEISFKSPYGRKGLCKIKLKSNNLVRVRIPTNCKVDIEKVEGCTPFIIGEWVYLKKIKSEIEVLLPFNLQTYYMEYLFRDKLIIFEWKGEEVLRATSSGKRLCYFKELDSANELIGEADSITNAIGNVAQISGTS